MLEQQSIKQSRHMLAIAFAVIAAVVVIVTSVFVFSDDIRSGFGGFMQQIKREFSSRPAK